MAIIVKDTNSKVGGGFGNDAEYITVRYDFSEDTGAIEDYTLFTADKACVVELSRIDVVTAATSGGAAVVDLGKGAGGTEFKSDIALATLSLDAQLTADTAETMVALAATDTIVMGLEAATLTAGVFDFVFQIFPR